MNGPDEPASGDHRRRDPAAPGTPDDPEVVEGEVVDDPAAAAFGGFRAGASGNRTAMGGDRTGSAGAGLGSDPLGHGFGPGGPMSMSAAFRMLGDAAPEARALLALPVRLLTIAVAVPAVLALLLGLAIDPTGPRVVAFVLAGCGAVAAVMLERGRRRLTAGRPMRARRWGPIGLVGTSVLTMMLSTAFDLLAVLLLLFAVW